MSSQIDRDPEELMSSVSPDTGSTTAMGTSMSQPDFLRDVLDTSSGLSSILQRLEDEREERWKRNSRAVQLKLHWRASAIKHTFHVLPGETFLEFGAGSGMLTKELHGVFQGENPLTSVVFSRALFEQARSRALRGVQVLDATGFSALAAEQFDYVIGAGLLLNSAFVECLQRIRRVLKPGGQLLFFEPSLFFPARLFNELRSRPKELRITYKVQEIVAACTEAGFVEADLAPYDMVSCRLGLPSMTRLEAKAVLLEHMPLIRSGCISMCLMARKRGAHVKPIPNLADLPALYGAVSVVVPAHNEAATIPGLVDRLMRLYGPYIHEIIIVNDNSSDETAAVVERISAGETRVRLVNQVKPNGVGFALRQGYRAATGRYILSMDSDVVEILPEFRGMFRAVAEGRDGAIGSRFSHESIVVNYPFAKLLFNRCCHVLIKLLLLSTVRDITNNLKLYRSDILKGLEITSPHFSANLETGLKPLLAGYDIVEVPISWINRTSEMGSSSFYLHKVGLAYARAFWACWRNRPAQSRGVIQLAWHRILRRIGVA